jgi:2'-5' RNA ligase
LTASSPRLFRVFVALDLPAEARAELAAWGAGQLGGVAGARLMDSASMHVTLCFLGGRPVGEMDAITEAMRLAVGERSALTLTPGAPIWLPRRRPRVAAVELSDGTGQVAALQAALASTLARGGWYEPETRPFLAHVTVARVGRSGLARPPELAPPPAVPFTAERVALYRSHTGPAGARYESLATVGLCG